MLIWVLAKSKIEKTDFTLMLKIADICKLTAIFGSKNSYLAIGGYWPLLAAIWLLATNSQIAAKLAPTSL